MPESIAKPLILASGSPRRHELLARMGVAFVVDVSDADENVGGTPEAMVTLLAQRKAQAVVGRHPNDLILAADTIVVCEGTILGKPIDTADAARMLTMLAGRWHEVYTGVYLVDTATGRSETIVALTRVCFTPLRAEDITRYVATGEPLDKAGAYGIQGQAGMFIEAIDGSPSNVMGLPMAATRALLQRFAVLPS